MATLFIVPLLASAFFAKRKIETNNETVKQSNNHHIESG